MKVLKNVHAPVSFCEFHVPPILAASMEFSVHMIFQWNVSSGVFLTFSKYFWFIFTTCSLVHGSDVLLELLFQFWSSITCISLQVSWICDQTEGLWICPNFKITSDVHSSPASHVLKRKNGYPAGTGYWWFPVFLPCFCFTFCFHFSVQGTFCNPEYSPWCILHGCLIYLLSGKDESVDEKFFHCTKCKSGINLL